MISLPVEINEIILLGLLALFSVIEIIYFLFFYPKTISGRNRKRTGPKHEPVSVIITARDSETALEAFLPSVLEQEYPEFEVIVVDDCSEDGTADLLKNLQKKYTHLRITTIYKDSSLYHNKKMALFLGIKAARNEILLFTDAGCGPVSKNWIKSVSGRFTKHTSFVLGYSSYEKTKGLANKFIRCDNLYNGMRYLGFAASGHPSIGSGRNLAYRRTVFFDNRGFGPFINLQSGDDDLFINQLANSKNCTIANSGESFTVTSAPARLGDYFKQRVIQGLSWPHYRRATRFMIMFESLSRILVYISLAIALIFTSHDLLALLIFLPGYIVKLITLTRIQKALNEKDLLLFSLLFDIVSPLVNSVLYLKARRNRN